MTFQKGVIKFLAVKEGYRGKGFARKLISSALKVNPNIEKLRTSFPDNDSLASFYEHIGFTKDKLYQYEMSC